MSVRARDKYYVSKSHTRMSFSYQNWIKKAYNVRAELDGVLCNLISTGAVVQLKNWVQLKHP